jgi:hypothetical protein
MNDINKYAVSKRKSGGGDYGREANERDEGRDTSQDPRGSEGI